VEEESQQETSLEKKSHSKKRRLREEAFESEEEDKATSEGEGTDGDEEEEVEATLEGGCPSFGVRFAEFALTSAVEVDGAPNLGFGFVGTMEGGQVLSSACSFL